MAIIHIQRSLRQVGRIRIGHQVRTSSGKMAPAKLDRFRLSSPQKEPIERAAELWGGTVAPMTNDRSNDRWEVITDTDSLRVIIPSTNHFDAWMELWGGAGCDRRCDGERMIVSDGRAVDTPCVCDPEARECKPTTRLFVLLPDLDALGTFRLETHGYYAASELSGAVELCSLATSQGRPLPARLELEGRTRRTRDEKGKPVTRNYAVPVLSVDVSIPQARQILGQVDVATGEITAPAPRPLASVPEPRQLEVRTPTAPVELPPPPAATIPAPRTADEYEAAQDDGCIANGEISALQLLFAGITDPDARKAAKQEFVAKFDTPEQLQVGEFEAAYTWVQERIRSITEPKPTPAEVADQPKLIDVPADNGQASLTKPARTPSANQRGKFFALAEQAGWDDDERHRRITELTAGRTQSFAEITATEADSLIGDLEAASRGAA